MWIAWKMDELVEGARLAIGSGEYTVEMAWQGISGKVGA